MYKVKVFCAAENREIIFTLCEAGLELYKQTNWAVRVVKHKAGGLVTYRLNGFINNKRVEFHNYLAGCKPPFLVDHTNNDSTDNRLCNLRLATKAQNGANRRKTSLPTQSRYKGVNRDKRSFINPWRARIYPNGKSVHLGNFKTELEAARAYDAAAIKYYGNFAALNFPVSK